MTDTLPTNDKPTVPASYVHKENGAVYVHHDLWEAIKPWETEAHVGPVVADEQFGDVASWCQYTQHYAAENRLLLTWNSGGLRAVLDYHGGGEQPGRCQWTAMHVFKRAPEWDALLNLAQQSVGHKAAIEKLEDLGEYIVAPAPADLMLLLRNLRATLNATAETEIRPDGTTEVSFTQNTKVLARGVALPTIIKFLIPVLAGNAQRYEIDVRVRASVGDGAHLELRFSLVNAQRTLETVIAEQVAAARAALGDTLGSLLLRAAG